MSLYPDVLRRLGAACSQYRERIVGVEELQSVVRQCEDAVTAFQERDLRKFLHWADGELELIRFTLTDAHIFEEAVKVVSKIEEMISR